jgi:hypothetical protein
MDTVKPGWTRIGQPVRVMGWVGVIADTATTETGKFILLIESPKAAWHGHAPEWLAYDPDLVQPAAAEDIELEISATLSRLEYARRRSEAMRPG